MNIKSRYIFLALLIVIMAAVLISATIKEDDTSEIITVNKDINRTMGFCVHSDSTDLNTSARGTIFVRGAGEIPENIRIVSWIEIDPDDWGGVAFYIPAGWHISGIMNSYPEKDARATPAGHVTTWTTSEPESEWSVRVEVGRDRGYLTAGRGTGTVVIDLLPDKDAIGQTGTFDIMVAVGSDEKDGVKICGTDYIEIPVS